MSEMRVFHCWRPERSYVMWCQGKGEGEGNWAQGGYGLNGKR